MRKIVNKKLATYFLLFSLLFLTSCGNFTGLRTPLYDGKAIRPNEKAIEIYNSTAEVVGAEKELYIRYPFSEDILEQSLEYQNDEPFLLMEGTYIIGEDLPAGRATLLGNESSFSSESYDVHVGNLIVRDLIGEIYYENLFHSEYGQLTAQFDLIEGHEITIIGKDPEITVFYADKLPKNPYVLMELPELIKNLDRMHVQQPIGIFQEGKVVHLTGGIYEVGNHLVAGEYSIDNLEAPHNTEMYLFRNSTDPEVIELLLEHQSDSEELEVSDEALDTAKQYEEESVIIELVDGDKIYLNLVQKLELILIDDK